MGTPVVFNYANWIAAFPQLSNVNATQAGNFFTFATLYWNNSGGWTTNVPQAPMLLDLLTAHIAFLWAPRDANGNPSSSGSFPPPAIVGRISSATEGSVTVQTEYDSNAGSPSEAWFTQTIYGAAFWQATLQFRSATYARTPFLPPQAGTFGGYVARGRVY